MTPSARRPWNRSCSTTSKRTASTCAARGPRRRSTPRTALMFDVIVGFLILNAVLLGAVGSLGLSTTMGINMMERIREIGVLRAIGASNGAIRRIVLLEGLVIATLSWVIGFALSFPIARSHERADRRRAARHAALLHLRHACAPIVWFFVLLVLAVAASLGPARSAVRLTIREVLWRMSNGSNGSRAAHGRAAASSSKGLNKAYRTAGGRLLRAARASTWRSIAGEFVALLGRSGAGKSTLDQHAHRHRPADGGRDLDRRAGRAQAERGKLTRWRGREVGVIFQSFQLMPMLTCAQNVMLPMDFAGLYGSPRKQYARAMRPAGRRSTSPNMPTSCRRPSRAASASVSPSPARWPTTPSFSPPTNRPAASIRARPMPSSPFSSNWWQRARPSSWPRTTANWRRASRACCASRMG